MTQPASLRPIRIAMPLPPGVHVGALVGYRGRIQSEHWSTFYVSEIDDRNRLTLIDRDYPNVTTLRQVAPVHVVATGKAVEMCNGGREAGNPGNGWNLHFCELRDCGCDQHERVRTS